MASKMVARGKNTGTIHNQGDVHTSTHPFCSDMAYNCHESENLIAKITQQVLDGFLTPDEATRLFQGRQL